LNIFFLGVESGDQMYELTRLNVYLGLLTNQNWKNKVIVYPSSASSFSGRKSSTKNLWQN